MRPEWLDDGGLRADGDQNTSTEMRRVGLIALPRHNFSLSAQIRVRLYSDSGMTSVVYDSCL